MQDQQNTGFKNSFSLACSSSRCICTLLSLLLLTACSSQQYIHIYNKGFEEARVSQLATSLSEQGFNASLTPLEVPDNFHENSLIYHPLISDLSMIEQIRQSMETAGFIRPVLYKENQANHFYSRRHIGLYLVNPAYRTVPAAPPRAANRGPTLSRLYYSACDAMEADLTLYREGFAILNVYQWDERRKKDRKHQHDADWTAADGLVTLDFNDGGRMLFAVDENSGKGNFGSYYRLDLLNMENSSAINDCNFRFTHFGSQNPPD